MDPDVEPLSLVGLCFVNLCERLVAANVADNCLFIIINRTSLVVGLPLDRPRWDDLQDSHIVSLYKTVARTADEFSYVFVAYLLGPESTLASDLHEAGIVRLSKLPTKLYVPKALSVLIEMCPCVVEY
jgi:hypothetical protein